MRYLAGALLMVLVLFSHVQPVRAHVLLRDEAVNIGAVLHINPDDDPIAGESSELYFDIQDKNSQVRIPYDGYELIITDQAGESVTVKTQTHDSTVIAVYTFPSQGLYNLKLKTQQRYDQFQKVTMENDLRVERGVSSAGLVVPDHDWAQTGLVLSVVVLLGVGVVAWNNRAQISRQSTWK